MTLTGRLLAAIDAREATARAATDGPWQAVYPTDDEVGVDVVPCDLTGAYVVCPDPAAGMLIADAQHIADNDPQAVIRHCEAHRRIVQRHAPTWAGGPGEPEYDYHYERTESRQMVEVRNAEPNAPYFCYRCQERSPCADLLDMATAYDITEEDT